jgi:hypothetical protein
MPQGLVMLSEWKSCVGKGWHPLLDELDAAIARLGYNVEILQVKEKFGMLRVYARCCPGFEHTEQLNALIRDAERASCFTCERCGREGSVDQDFPWRMTLCEPCKALRKTDRRAFREEFHGPEEVSGDPAGQDPGSSAGLPEPG